MSTPALSTTDALGERPVLGVLRSVAAALVSVTEASRDGRRLWALSEDELGECLALAAQVVASAQAVTAAVVIEADERGAGVQTALSRTDWVLGAAGSMEAAEAARVARLARACREPALAGLRDAVTSGAVGVVKGAIIGDFAQEARPLADPGALDETVATLVCSAPALTVPQLRTAVRYALNHLRPAADLEREADVQRASRAFHRTGVAGTGMCEYRLVLDPEAAAIVDAAVAGLSRPQPDAVTGARDPRPAATRRADALVELVQRALSGPPTRPGMPQTQLVVTMGFEVLAGAVRGAGLTPAGAVVTVETVRRLACDAEIIPAVLGTSSQVVDLGRSRRLVSRGQRTKLWLRDAHCTYPGCTIPAAWTQAHHIRHWSDGGPTNESNLALLCARHHTVVHQRGLTASITPGAPPGAAVTWHDAVTWDEAVTCDDAVTGHT